MPGSGNPFLDTMASRARGKLHPGSAALLGTLLGPMWFLLLLSCDLQNGPIKHQISPSRLHPSIQVVTTPWSILLPKYLSNYLMPHATCAPGHCPQWSLFHVLNGPWGQLLRSLSTPMLSIHRPRLLNYDLSKSQIQSGLSLQSFPGFSLSLENKVLNTAYKVGQPLPAFPALIAITPRGTFPGASLTLPRLHDYASPFVPLVLLTPLPWGKTFSALST